MDIWRILKIAQNAINQDVYRSILSSVKEEPVLTNNLSVTDFLSAFNRLQSDDTTVTSVICHPVRIEDIRLACVNSTFYRERELAEATDFDLVTKPYCAWVASLMTAVVRVCESVDIRRIWVASGVAQDSDWLLLSDGERGLMDQFWGEIEPAISPLGDKIHSVQIILC